MDALVASGALVPAGTPLHRRLTDSYAAVFSARFRSRFDPDYLFTPPVDYIATRAITLPPQMPNAALMVARGVPALDMNENHNSRILM